MLLPPRPVGTLAIGDEFWQDQAPLSRGGKPIHIRYTVTGRETYYGREYMTVHSDRMGDGSIRVDEMVEPIASLPATADSLNL